MEIQACSNCGAVLHTSTKYFAARKDCKSGINKVCRYCMLLRKRQYKLKNKVHIAAQDKAYREQHRPKYAEYSRSYRERNRETVTMRDRQYNANRKEYRTAYREMNKDKIKEQKRAWVKNNKHKIQAMRQRRRASEQQLLATLTEDQWIETKNYFSDRCAYCGRKLKLTQDHFIPLAKGGAYTQENIIPACKSCNSSKCDKDFMVWYPSYKYFSEESADAILEYINAMIER